MARRFSKFLSKQISCGCVTGMRANEQSFEKVNTHPSHQSVWATKAPYVDGADAKNFNVLAFPSPVSTSLVKLFQQICFQRIFACPMFRSKDKIGDQFCPLSAGVPLLVLCESLLVVSGFCCFRYY